MKILGIHADPCHIGGHTRLFLSMMDIFKALGHDVHIVGRTKEDTVAKVEMPIMDPSKAEPLFTQVEVIAKMDLSHHDVRDLRKFQPLHYIIPSDISFHDIPVVYWGDHFLTPWAPEVIAKMEEADYVFVDTEMYVRMEADLPIADKHIQFVHFPTENLMPVLGKEPKMLWVNSAFTQSWVKIRWGYNNPDYTKIDDEYATVQIPKQIFQAEVVNPPIYVDDYKNDSGFSNRRYDVVMFARLGEDKFTVADYIDKNFRLLSLGALSPINRTRPQTAPQKGVKQVNLTAEKPMTKPFKPKGELHKDLTFDQIKQFLKQAKVYVHGKGFGMMQSGGASLPEHFGISIIEAMAAGCPAIVPRAGGCWSDISLQGKYTLAYSSLEELKFNVERLTKNRDEWEKWHNLALEGVQRFDAENIKAQVKELLN